jgi:hypothetical protein
MPNDPDLAGDTCIFSEAISGDGGVHNPNDTWWLSPDINLVGPVSGADKADPGQVNKVQVKFHRKPAGSNCVFPNDENINVQLWVGNPSLVMAPDNPASTALVGFIGQPTPPEGGSATQPIDWTPPNGLPPDDPQSSGHKCLIARCYPDSLTPSATSFFVPDDQHVVQHNICIVPCGGPGALTAPGPCSLRVTTLNPNRQNAQPITLRAVLDLKPNDFVRKTVGQRTKRVFGQLATRPPRAFGFDVSPLRAQVSDHSHPSVVPSRPPNSEKLSFEAVVKLPPLQLIKIKFFADLTKTHPGDFFIFHLTQLGPANRVQGGLTVVMGVV